MASTAVRVIFEIGHNAVVRAKETSQGFTHDWELYIRGADNTDIQHFVDKVVFHLHVSFPNPKRVVKEPPYIIRESGYAGFTVFIDLYLKNKPPAEPNKISFEYHLTLQPCGDPPLKDLKKEKYVFQNPTEDFRRKLIKGGGVGVGAESASGSHPSHMASINSSHSMGDHKNSASKSKSSQQEISAKKSKKESIPKCEELKHDNSFSYFGSPIINNQIPLTTKSNSKTISDKVTQPEKQAHSSKPKHNSSSHKDKDKDKEREKDKDREKEKQKDREKDKDKSSVKKTKDESVKKEKNKEEKSKVLKSSKEDSKKNSYSEERSKDKSVEKTEKEVKSEKKENEKKHKDEKKLKFKEKHNAKKENIDVHENYTERSEKLVVTKEESQVNNVKEEKKVQKVFEDKEEKIDKIKKEKSIAEPKSLFNNGNVSSVNLNNPNNPQMVGNFEKKEEKHKHHKHKKEKSKKDCKREKEDKKEKLKEPKENKERPPSVPLEQPKSTPKSDSPKRNKKPLERLVEQLTDRSDTETSSLEEEIKLPGKETQPPSPPVTMTEVKEESPIPFAKHEEQLKDEKLSSSGKKKNKKSTEEKESKKRKRKSKHKEESATVKVIKCEEDDGHPTENAIKQTNTAAAIPILEVQQSPILTRESSMSPISETKFTDEYINKLKDLQRKIMTLDDNSGLQRIVQMVAETGQYEITTKTFDFDLCSLDESIVDRLQEFFLP